MAKTLTGVSKLSKRHFLHASTGTLALLCTGRIAWGTDVPLQHDVGQTRATPMNDQKLTRVDEGIVEGPQGELFVSTRKGADNTVAILFLHSDGGTLHHWDAIRAKLGGDHTTVAFDRRLRQLEVRGRGRDAGALIHAPLRHLGGVTLHRSAERSLASVRLAR